MFKLKINGENKKIIAKKLSIIETKKYHYVITNDKNLVEDDKINIVFNMRNLEKASNLLDLIVKGEKKYIAGYNQYGQKYVEINDIIYFEANQNDIYAITSKTKLQIPKKLYEIEDKLQNNGFVRISKHCIVNIAKIEYIRPLINAKLELLMVNNDICEVNRSYRKQFKEALKE